MALLLFLIMLGIVCWRGRRIPLTGWRKRAAIGARVAACAALCAALLGVSHQQAQTVPRRVVYLIDGSASIDASQRAWMASRVASLDAVRPAQMERAVVVFGRNTANLVPIGREPLSDPQKIRQLLEQAPLQRDRTDMETAVLAALPFFAPAQRGSIILLSDGRETTGDVRGLLGYVRRSGLQIFPVAVPVFGATKTTWEALTVPPVVQRGSPVPLHMLLFNGASQAASARITVRLHDVVMKAQRVTVRPGWQALTLSIPAVARGPMPLDVEVAIPEQGLAQRRRAYTQVEGPPRLLMVSEQVSSVPPLAAALRRRGIEVALARPAELPTQVEPLLEHDAVVLFNSPKSSVTPAQVDALRRYLQGFGGGLITVGLGGDLASEVTHPSALDALLPVTFEPKGLQETKRRVCFIMLIDRSASMLGPRIAATKRAAVALVKQLSPEDLVGVLAFDVQPYVVAEVQPARQVGPWLVEKLVTLRSSGGTDVYPAMTAAVNRLDLTGATLKHIILLTDGQTPFHEQAYRALIVSLKLSSTTVSTVGIGSAFVNVEFLQWLAQSTGGTFYQLRSLDELPQLLARDTQHELGRLPFTEGYFRPVKTAMTDWFPEIVQWPALRGYLTATPRATARVDLVIRTPMANTAAAPAARQAADTAAAAAAPPDPEGKRVESEEPLLARWSVGRGRVVSFASDADAQWSPEWVRWDQFEGVWAHIIRWAMRPRLTEDLFVRTEEREGAPRLIVEGELRDPRGVLVAADGAAQRPISLVQTGTWRWETPLDDVPSGWYQLTVESRIPGNPDDRRGASRPGEVNVPEPHRGATASGRETPPETPPVEEESSVFATRWVQIGTPPTSSELTGLPSDEAWLQHIAHATGGTDDLPDRAFVPPTTKVQVSLPLWGWWLPLAIVALLIDIALRGSSML